MEKRRWQREDFGNVEQTVYRYTQCVYLSGKEKKKKTTENEEAKVNVLVVMA